MKRDLQEQVPQWLSLKEKYRPIAGVFAALTTRSKLTRFMSAAIVASSSARTICARIADTTTDARLSSPKGSKTYIPEMAA